MTTALLSIDAAAGQLESVGIISTRLDARLLMAHSLGITREQLALQHDRILTNKEISDFHALVARRSQFEPIAYITGEKEFWSLDFYVTRDTLIPRPDSETLVEAALKRIRSRNRFGQAEPITLLDIGTGTGCLLIALLKELPEARGIGVDTSEPALQVARKNAKRHGVEARADFIRSHWCDALEGTFDLIVSNPPYIAEAAMAALMPDVARFEPRAALSGGQDGLDAYRALSSQAASRLNRAAYVLFEVGEGQAEAVEKLLRAQGLEPEETAKDLSGVARCVIARKDGQEIFSSVAKN